MLRYEMALEDGRVGCGPAKWWAINLPGFGREEVVAGHAAWLAGRPAGKPPVMGVAEEGRLLVWRNPLYEGNAAFVGYLDAAAQEAVIGEAAAAMGGAVEPLEPLEALTLSLREGYGPTGIEHTLAELELLIGLAASPGDPTYGWPDGGSWKAASEPGAVVSLPVGTTADAVLELAQQFLPLGQFRLYATVADGLGGYETLLLQKQE